MYTLQGKIRPTQQVRFLRQSMYTWCTLPVGGPRMWQHFVKSSTTLDRSTALEKKGSRYNPQHTSWPIRRSVSSFSTKAAIEVVGVKPPSIDGRLLGLPGPYHRYVISMFNTCSWVPTPQSLTDTDGATTQEPQNSHSTLPALPFRVFHWSP
jgi:hypothetical protein